MSMISVKAKQGRTVRETPNGKFIPDTEYVLVENTAYIRRLIHTWGDLEVEPTKAAKKAAEKPPEPVAVPTKLETAPAHTAPTA